MPDTRSGTQVEYKTWFDFKRELETILGQGLPVGLWLRTKPKRPLPWYDTDLHTTLAELSKIQQPPGVSRVPLDQLRIPK